MSIKKVKLDDIAKSRGRTSKETLDKITDRDISESVLSDKDSVIPTEKELKEFEAPKHRGRDNEKES